MEKDIHDTSALEKRLAELKRLTDEYSLVSEKLSQEVSLCAQKLAAASTGHETALGEEKAAVQKLNLAKEAAEKVLEENHLPPADKFVPDRENILRLPELSERLKQFVSAFPMPQSVRKSFPGSFREKNAPISQPLKSSVTVRTQNAASLISISAAQRKISKGSPTLPQTAASAWKRLTQGVKFMHSKGNLPT